MEPEPAAASVVFGDRVELARDYAGWLAGAGVVRGLLGPREAGKVWTRHILNCGVVGELLPHDGRVVDIGSGAGLPGIPLAIARSGCSVILVEPLQRRVGFLREVVEALGLTNCRVVRGRADEVVKECGDADVVTSRAVAPLARLASWSIPLVRSGGEILALKGSSAADEIARDGSAAALLGWTDLRVELAGVDVIDPPTVVIRGFVHQGSRGRRK